MPLTVIRCEGNHDFHNPRPSTRDEAICRAYTLSRWVFCDDCVRNNRIPDELSEGFKEKYGVLARADGMALFTWIDRRG